MRARNATRGQTTPVILIILVLITIGLTAMMWQYIKPSTRPGEKDPGTDAKMVFAFDPVMQFPCEANLCGREGDLCLTLRNGGADMVSIRDLGRMSIKLNSAKTAKSRVVMPYELYVYYDEETVVGTDGKSYKLCCNVTDPEVKRISQCGTHTGVLANKRVTLGFNTTAYDEYMEERYSFFFEG